MGISGDTIYRIRIYNSAKSATSCSLSSEPRLNEGRVANTSRDASAKEAAMTKAKKSRRTLKSRTKTDAVTWILWLL